MTPGMSSTVMANCCAALVPGYETAISYGGTSLATARITGSQIARAVLIAGS